MITYKQCPVCNSNQINNFFTVKDYTVSNENFDVVKCNTCTLMFTQNVAAQNEIGRYYQSDNYISHSDTQLGIVNKLYHFVRKRTLVSKLHLVRKETNLECGKMLDVGCGTGAFLNTMQQAGWVCTGLEPDEIARKKAAEINNIYPLAAHEIFNLPENNYHAITMWHVLEHVHELQAYIAQLKKLITQNGKIFIAVPNYTSYDAQHYGACWAAYDVPRHLYHFSPTSMQNLIEQHGLTIKKIIPMWYDSYYVSMLSEKYKNGKGNIVKAFYIGFVSNLKTLFNKQRCSSLIYVIGKN